MRSNLKRNVDNHFTFSSHEALSVGQRSILCRDQSYFVLESVAETADQSQVQTQPPCWPSSVAFSKFERMALTITEEWIRERVQLKHNNLGEF